MDWLVVLKDKGGNQILYQYDYNHILKLLCFKTYLPQGSVGLKDSIILRIPRQHYCSYFQIPCAFSFLSLDSPFLSQVNSLPIFPPPKQVAFWPLDILIDNTIFSHITDSVCCRLKALFHWCCGCSSSVQLYLYSAGLYGNTSFLGQLILLIAKM